MSRTHFKIAGFLVAILALSGCIQITTNQTGSGFVDGYAPALLEARGTPCQGDYFPFAPGYRWDFSGPVTESGTSTNDGQQETIDDEYTATGWLEVGDPVQLSLKTGTFQAYPMDEITNDYGERRYFANVNGEIQIKALQYGDNPPIEVKNPEYLKKDLHVGDSWRTEPKFDFNQYLQDITGDTNTRASMDMECKFFVLGRDSMMFNGKMLQTLVVEQRAEATGRIASDTLTASFHLREYGTYHMALDIGIIDQNMTDEIQMSGTSSGHSSGINEVVKSDLVVWQFSKGNSDPSSNSSAKISAGGRGKSDMRTMLRKAMHRAAGL